MKLSQLILEGITYRDPNFAAEWEEAERYSEFVEMGKQGWIDVAKKGYVTSYSKIKNVLGNVDLRFDKLNPDKKQRFLDAFKRGTIEMSIAVKFSDTDYDLVAGNTRLSGLVKNGIDPKIWIVDISDLQENASEHEKGFEQRLMYRLGQKFKGDFKLIGSDLFLNGSKILTVGSLDTYNSIIRKVRRGLEENYADGKVKGKSRPGRVKKSGASCKGSVTDLRAKAKKYGGEKGKMYHWCANMKGGKK